MTHEPLRGLYVEQLRDLYNAEHQILLALPRMIDAVTHAGQTRQHVIRLQRIFDQLGEGTTGLPCEGMRGIIAEGERVLRQYADSDLLDAAIIAAVQRVEHYEIAGYGCVRSYAEMLGLHDQASVLQQTLDEEGEADHQLTDIAESVVNQEAIRA